jgi:hypothetical protein
MIAALRADVAHLLLLVECLSTQPVLLSLGAAAPRRSRLTHRMQLTHRIHRMRLTRLTRRLRLTPRMPCPQVS